VSTIHFLLALGAFGQAFALGDAGVPIPQWLVVTNSVLGFPAFFVVPDAVMIALRPWLGDDSNGLMLLFALNALIWGIALAVAIRAVRQHRARASEAPASQSPNVRCN
jgi:hypothetical protein